MKGKCSICGFEKELNTCNSCGFDAIIKAMHAENKTVVLQRIEDKIYETQMALRELQETINKFLPEKKKLKRIIKKNILDNF